MLFIYLGDLQQTAIPVLKTWDLSTREEQLWVVIMSTTDFGQYGSYGSMGFVEQKTEIFVAPLECARQ